MNPGEFRHTTTINFITESQQSDFGDFVTAGTTSLNRFAKVKWLPGSEQINSDVVALIKNVEFTYRYESLTEFLDRIDTITYENEIYYIKNVIFKGAGNKQLVLIKGQTAES